MPIAANDYLGSAVSQDWFGTVTAKRGQPTHSLQRPQPLKKPLIAQAATSENASVTGQRYAPACTPGARCRR